MDFFIICETPLVLYIRYTHSILTVVPLLIKILSVQQLLAFNTVWMTGVNSIGILVHHSEYHIFRIADYSSSYSESCWRMKSHKIIQQLKLYVVSYFFCCFF